MAQAAAAAAAAAVPRRESGYVQVGVSFEAARQQMVVALWAAEGLRMVESHEDVALPRPYAVARLGVYGYVEPCSSPDCLNKEKKTSNGFLIARLSLPLAALIVFPFFPARFIKRRNRVTFSTEVEDATPHPVWRMKHLFSLDQEEAYACKLEVSVWNYSHSGKHECLGEGRKVQLFPLRYSQA